VQSGKSIRRTIVHFYFILSVIFLEDAICNSAISYVSQTSPMKSLSIGEKLNLTAINIQQTARISGHLNGRDLLWFPAQYWYWFELLCTGLSHPDMTCENHW
jgi:hypothetical protein